MMDFVLKMMNFAKVGASAKALLAQYGEEGRGVSLDVLCSTVYEFREQWLAAVESLSVSMKANPSFQAYFAKALV